jgi:hypothetical protein
MKIVLDLLDFCYGAKGAACASLVGTTTCTRLRTASSFVIKRSDQPSIASTKSTGEELSTHVLAAVGLTCHDALETAL